MKSVRILPLAIRELRAAYRWYESERLGLGAEFMKSVHSTLETVRTHPTASTLLGTHTRRVLVARFPYVVLFTVEADQVLVVAIQHMHRDPRAWADRVHDRASSPVFAQV